MGISDLHDQYTEAANDNNGQVPVVEFTGGKHAKVGKGATSIPQFKIVKWVPRPVELEDEEAAPAVSISAPPADQQSTDDFD